VVQEIRKDGTPNNLINQDKLRQYRSNFHSNLSNVKVEDMEKEWENITKSYLRITYRNHWNPTNISEKSMVG
jgi:hypothetical protein